MQKGLLAFLFVFLSLGFAGAQVSHPSGQIFLPDGGTLEDAVPSGATICTSVLSGDSNCVDDGCSTGACTVSIGTPGVDDIIAGGTVNTCARFDANGYLVSAGGDCSAGDTDTDTNAGTACSGVYSYLNGEGNCRDVRVDGDLYDSYAADTHAGTHCSGTYSYLNGAGHCRDVRADGDIYDTDTNTHYCPSGNCPGGLSFPIHSTLGSGTNVIRIKDSGTGDMAFTHSGSGAFSFSGANIWHLGAEIHGADFVFEDDYPLMPLNELSRYVSRYKHLPNVPDAEDAKAWENIALQNRDMLMLEKIEELVLYTIEQQEQIDELKTQNEKLKSLVCQDHSESDFCKSGAVRIG